ncbi:hypothetical protein Bpfe_021393 [Biomphalaria pfeifferi]|uniref:Uncharacterized protein n=1 Tax=Biomphalaria pfeifferi TaxID=112525 RepID=A0AAD8F3V8_BIOPF|nr:hypothetical protein Bpfe_021393 [Biomphalaria pfeifferi]
MICVTLSSEQSTAVLKMLSEQSTAVLKRDFCLGDKMTSYTSMQSVDKMTSYTSMLSVDKMTSYTSSSVSREKCKEAHVTGMKFQLYNK